MLSKLLTSQEPVINVPKRQVKSSACVLTSTKPDEHSRVRKEQQKRSAEQRRKGNKSRKSLQELKEK